VSEVETPEEGEGKGRRRRRPRQKGEPLRGLFLLPHFVTTAGLFFGFYAIVQAFNDKPELSALGIVLAAICDTIDGRLARLTRSTSRFGMEFDSTADTVSFGVAPAMLAFSAGNLHTLGRTGWVMAFLFTACAALRLARFNVSPGRYRGRFEGLPSPAGACMVASTVWFVGFLRTEMGMDFSVA
jgi:CDP-diacylglycerol--serine O-phosphatidyltransferase